MDSVILSSEFGLSFELRQEQLSFLNKILSNPVRVERIFRASEHNFKAAAFHKYCDNKEDTLMLVRTEFGKTIGGYTHYPWTSNNTSVNDPGCKAFIFSLDMKEKFVP